MKRPNKKDLAKFSGPEYSADYMVQAQDDYIDYLEKKIKILTEKIQSQGKNANS